MSCVRACEQRCSGRARAYAVYTIILLYPSARILYYIIIIVCTRLFLKTQKVASARTPFGLKALRERHTTAAAAEGHVFR